MTPQIRGVPRDFGGHSRPRERRPAARTATNFLDISVPDFGSLEWGLPLIASLIGPLIRDHWASENSLHWVLDMAFRDDECRLRTDHAPANFTTLKHTALNLIRRTKTKDSIRLRRKVAAWDDEFLVNLIAA